jgi:LPS-assembly protein
MRPVVRAGFALVAAMLAGPGRGNEAPSPSPPLQWAPRLVPPATTAPGPTHLRARAIETRIDLDARASGDVELRRGGTVLKADRIDWTQVDDIVRARGNVRIERDGAAFRGPELQLQLQRFEGFFLQPEFDFNRFGAGGSAARFDFIDATRGRAIDARYTSCGRDGSGTPDWMLSARRLHLDTEANEGIAEGGRLVFLGLPILAIPRLSFPITGERKSGWLPPTLNIDNRSGIELSLPWYWNVAPNRDATIMPKVATRRGAGVEGEFRYLEPVHEGQVNLDLLPGDRLANANRWQTRLKHEGAAWEGRYALAGVRVSDDDWWKDFPRTPGLLTQRLLPLAAGFERPLRLGVVDATAYLRTRRYQVLQDSEAPIASPYDRALQFGLRHAGERGGIEWQAEIEANRFTLAVGMPSATRPAGWRAHLLAGLARPWRSSAGWLTPRLQINAATYDLDQAKADDGRSHLSRTIPTASIDGGLIFERLTDAFGREGLKQTLEPRLLYVRTPYRAQSSLLAFDSAPKDFSISSIFSDNAFTGIDLVSDANQLTAGVTTRLVEPASGAELLRLGLVQRYQFDEQRITPLDQPQRRFSDVLLLGSTSVVPNWTLDASLQFNADVGRLVRSILSARFSPGPFRTLGGTYRLARDLRDPLRGIQSEVVELGWQWPVWGDGPLAAGDSRPAARAAGGACRGRLYSVGRLNYSMTDSRITDSIIGLEYDAGCWIGRVVAERLSTGRSEATTRLMLQLELIGLSRLGTNPLKVLKDNIPGYQLLRDDGDELSSRP